MRPTEILSAEHRVIERVLTCLERLADEARTSGALDGDAAEQALAFVRTFADACHHGKEEDRLFPKLVELGLPREHGPIAVMLGEHEQGRAHVRAMLASREAAARGEAEALETFVREARAYVALLRDHIDKEDHVLFPMADGFLTLEAVDELLAGFAEAEGAHEPGTHERMLAVASELGDRFGVPQVSDGATGGRHGCGHACGGSGSPA